MLLHRFNKQGLKQTMRVTIKDIAEQAGVSKTTVSLYMNKHRLADHIADATKRRIDEAVERMGYKPSSTARALSIGKTKTLGLVVGGIANEYFSHFAEAALEESSRHGYQLLVSLTRWDQDEEQRCLETLIDRQTDGILYYPRLQPRGDLAETLQRSSYPLLLIDQESSAFSTVRNDIAPALDQAVKELRRKGHRRISGLFGDFDQWRKAFLSACKSNDVEADMLQLPLSSMKEQQLAALKLCSLRPEALITSRRTAGMLLKAIGESCPDYRPDIIFNYDISCDFISDERVAGIVYCHSARLVRMAVQTLIEMVEHREASQAVQVRIPADFIMRSNFGRLAQDDANEIWQ